MCELFVKVDWLRNEHLPLYKNEYTDTKYINQSKKLKCKSPLCLTADLTLKSLPNLMISLGIIIFCNKNQMGKPAAESGTPIFTIKN